MKVCDLCNQNVSKLTDIFLLNNKEQFDKKDACDGCFEKLEWNYIRIWFEYYPFYKLLDNKISKELLKEYIFWRNFPSFYSLGHASESGHTELLTESTKKTEKECKKITTTDILNAKETFKNDLETIVYDFELKKKYGYNKLLVDCRIWEPWRYDTQRFALDEYIVRYDFNIYLYSNTDVNMIKNYIFKKLSNLRFEFINLVDYIKYKDLKSYIKGLYHERKEEIDKINMMHNELFNATLEDICFRMKQKTP